MNKLYMITIGGKAKGANIEVHDVQFIIANNIKETYKILKENLYGIDLKLHLDAYKHIDGADGFTVEIDENSEIQTHVSIVGNTKIGKNNKIYPFSSIGKTSHIVERSGPTKNLFTSPVESIFRGRPFLAVTETHSSKSFPLYPFSFESEYNSSGCTKQIIFPYRTCPFLECLMMSPI